MVNGCGCEGRQDENSDYICAKHILCSLLIILMCVLLFILQRIFVTNIILSNVYDLNIACVVALS